MKRLALALLAVGGGALLLASRLTWFEFTTDLKAATSTTFAVPGTVAAPALIPFGLSAFALLGVLLITGALWRRILGAITVLLGAATLWQGASALGDPVSASAPAIREHTGISGMRTIREAVEAGAYTQSFGPMLAIVGALLLIAAGTVALVTASRWPEPKRRYERQSATVMQRVDNDGDPDRDEVADSAQTRIDQWDALSGGDDPTER